MTAPAAWTRALHKQRPPRFDPAVHRRVVVVAAHPDDETLGAGGALRAMYGTGADITLVVATDGEAAYRGLGAAARRDSPVPGGPSFSRRCTHRGWPGCRCTG